MIILRNNIRCIARIAFVILVFGTLTVIHAAAQPSAARFEIKLPADIHNQPVTGRAFVMITRDATTEPRFQAGARYMGCPFFGVDVEQLQPGSSVIIDGATLGYPTRSLREIPEGDYFVQAFFNVYTAFHRSDGHVIWAHMDQWEGQDMFHSPGNLFSPVQKVHLDPAGFTIKLELSQEIPPLTPSADTAWVKHIKIQSDLLTKFWGRPMYLGATVLLPRGYEDHPDVHFPVVYEQDHFRTAPPYRFRTEPSNAASGSVLRMREDEGYRLYQDWISDRFPRMLLVSFLHPTPYYDDSYAVNSANNGPYGDAIMKELIPYIETHFRIISEPYARVLSGGSTGGWESFALQVQHPEFFGGAWIYYPDPIDFQYWELTNIYDDDNMFFAPPANGGGLALGTTDWQKVQRPFLRLPNGQVIIDQKQESQLEEVLGSKGRSGEQSDAWQAVYGPVGADGYPVPLWNKETGEIDHKVALYMRDHGYDLADYLRRNWEHIGDQLTGKLHFYVGDMDNFYLNLAVYRLEQFLEKTTHPYYAGSFEYGRPLKGHGIRPTSSGEMLRRMAEEIRRRSGTSNSSGSWNY